MVLLHLMMASLTLKMWYLENKTHCTIFSQIWCSNVLYLQMIDTKLWWCKMSLCKCLLQMRMPVIMIKLLQMAVEQQVAIFTLCNTPVFLCITTSCCTYIQLHSCILTHNQWFVMKTGCKTLGMISLV